MSLKRPHIVRSLWPLREHAILFSACSKEIPDPVFVLTVEGDISGKMELSEECFCKKCIQVCKDNPCDTRYLYGVVPSNWIKSKQAEHED